MFCDCYKFAFDLGFPTLFMSFIWLLKNGINVFTFQNDMFYFFGNDSFALAWFCFYLVDLLSYHSNIINFYFEINFPFEFTMEP